MRKFNPKMLKVYLVAGSQNTNNIDQFLSKLTEACKDGITMFQFREKGPKATQGEQKIQLGKQVKRITDQYNVPLIVDDDLNLAQDIKADGIHVGQSDMSTLDIDKKAPNMILGLSVHDIKELDNSKLNGVDYLGVGPIYPTQSKSNAESPVGPQGINKIAEHTNLPIVAIGGIQEFNINHVLKSKTNGVSVISSIMQSNNIYKTIQILKKGTK